MDLSTSSDKERFDWFLWLGARKGHSRDMGETWQIRIHQVQLFFLRMCKRKEERSV